MPGEPTELQRALSAAFAGDEAPLLALLPRYELGGDGRALAIVRSFPSPEQAPWILDLLPQVLHHGARSPDPLMALNNWERFLRAAIDPYSLHRRFVEKPIWIEILTVLFSHSQFLADIVVRHPEVFDWLSDPMMLYGDRAEEYYRRRAREVTALFSTPDKKHAALCRWQRLELFRIGARDLLGAAAVEQITCELSLLAESIIETAFDLCLEQAVERWGEPRLDTPPDAAGPADRSAHADAAPAAPPPASPCAACVFAMGKLGGRELNFSSDVDLIFVYEGEGETTGRSAAGDGPAAPAQRLSNHEFFTKVCEALIRFLGQSTPDGRLYRVDVRLRPEGRSGPLIRSLVAYENYFFSQGRIWERAAYLKARLIAGSPTLGARFNALVTGFCFAPESPERLQRNLVEIKRLMDGDIGPDGARLDIKRGRGGIREIEFAVAALQLIHGTHEPALRPKNFWTAVDALHRHGLLAAEERNRIVSAYDFLRSIEHRLQIMAERQTHELPAGERERRQLAQRLGLWPDVAPHKLLDVFERRLKAVRAFVHDFYLTTLNARDEDEHSPQERLVSALYAPDPDPEVLLARLAPFGFEKLSSVQCLLTMARGSSEIYVSARGQRLFRQVLPHILEECRCVPFPDDAIRNLDHFLHAAKGIASYYSLFLDSAGARKLILRLFGTSNYCARALVARPEIFDALLEWGLPPDADYGTMIEDYYQASARSMTSFEARLDFLRLFKQQEWLRIVLRDLFAAGTEAAHVPAQLTRLAELCLREAAGAAFERAVEKFALPPQAAEALSRAWTIAALGSFGGEMLSYFSDLDVVFLFEPPPDDADWTANPTEFFTAWANDVINIMSRPHERGELFKTDARLRPEGRNAPIVAPLERYTDYYARRAQTWEFLTAVKLRPVAGNPALGEKLRAAIQSQMGRFAADTAWLDEVRSMRRRLEQSAEAPGDAIAEFKRGPGGLADIDFIVQTLLLRRAAALPAVPARKIEAIAVLRDAGALDASDAQALLENFLFLKKLEARLRLMFETTGDLMPADPARLRALATAMSSADLVYSADQLCERLKSAMAVNRSLFEKYV
ncbi:MAG: bifunctional [glutamate--ammonia ligase]-adenylyl-L-tyrosine phosphorylase/[glutamate--ammonia-ligase] adenylyltransferase [Candidatus Sumerlaeia bacterium]